MTLLCLDRRCRCSNAEGRQVSLVFRVWCAGEYYMQCSEESRAMTNESNPDDPCAPKEETTLMSSGWVWGTRRAVCEAHRRPPQSRP